MYQIIFPPCATENNGERARTDIESMKTTGENVNCTEIQCQQHAEIASE